MAELIGVLGGTFDPVHFGHLRPALDVLQTVPLNQIRFIPNNQPPHRDPPWLSQQQRKSLINLAIEDVPEFVLDDCELNREGQSYMVDTLAILREKYPDVHLCLIIGMDAFNHFTTWHRWKTILDYCHLVVTTRPGYQWPASEQFRVLESRRVPRADELHLSQAGKILLQSVTQLDISSSLIRHLVQSGKDARFLLPEKVYEQLLEYVKA